MIRFLILLGFIYFVFCHSVHSNIIDRCSRYFRSDPIKYNLSKNTKWNNSYAQELFSSVYQQISQLEKKEFSDKEIKNYTSQLERLINFIHTSSSSDVTNRLDRMGSHLSSAIKAFPEIVSFVQSDKFLSYPLNANQILQLILSTFSQHIEAYLKHPHPDQLDWPRIQTILEQISFFKDQPNIFSLYKITRAIRQKYSVREYINCK